MPGTLPNTDFYSVTVKEATPTITTTALSGQSQRKQLLAQLFELEIKYPALTRKETKEIMGFLNSNRNSLYDFSITLPEIGDTDGNITQVLADNGSLTGIIQLDGAASLGDSSIDFDSDCDSSYFASSGVSASAGLVAGDFIKFANHNKVYKITSDVTFNATGGGTINIFPNLVADVPSLTTVVYNQVPFLVYNADPMQKVDYGVSGYGNISLKLRESI